MAGARIIPKPVQDAIIENHLHLSKLYDWYICRDFIEVIGAISGDSVTYRIYSDGRVVEK